MLRDFWKTEFFSGILEVKGLKSDILYLKSCILNSVHFVGIQNEPKNPFGFQEILVLRPKLLAFGASCSFSLCETHFRPMLRDFWKTRFFFKRIWISKVKV